MSRRGSSLCWLDKTLAKMAQSNWVHVYWRRLYRGLHGLALALSIMFDHTPLSLGVATGTLSRYGSRSQVWLLQRY
jgi:hypothetical protein